MNQTRLKIEHLLYGAAFLLALVVRLAGADHLPLTNREAELALQALALSRGQAPLIGPHPAYLILTTLMMYIFNSGNWVARFWPALAGSLLVLVPMLFRGRLGKLPAVLLAFFLALDPGLLGVSRQAGSLALALLFTMLAMGLWINRRTALAGIAAGMALLSGPQIWPGLIGLGLAAWIAGRMDPPAQTAADNLPEQVQKAPLQEGWKRALLFAVATVLLVGTLFFAIPDGLSAIADSIPAYLRGWAAPGVPLGLMLVSLLVYELFPLVFGVWGGVLRLVRMDPKGLSLRSLLPVDRFLLAWWIIALVLALAYPGRQVSDLAWSLLPLWGLAARQVARMVSAPAYDRLPMFGQMALAAVILAYISMALFSVANGVLTNPLEYRVRLAGALIMLVASTALIAWGWSGMVALRGASWGLGILLMITMISAGWNAVGLSGRAGEELWSGEPRFTGANLLAGTLSDLNQLSMPPQVGGPDVVVVGMPSPALDWVLRGVRRISYTGQLPGDASPSIVITNGQPALALASTYRGQNFVLSESTGWNQFQLVDWLRWLAFRTVPAGAQQQEQITLWARSDLFPGGSVKK